MTLPIPAAGLRTARILVVDDSAVMRSLLRSVIGCDQRLEVAGTASDGASALRVLDSLKPDLILLDVEMPGMDGLSTLKQIKAKGSRIPVIMCSGLTQRGAKVTIEALAAGAADYVAKPAGQPSREVAVVALAHDLVPKILALTATQTEAAPSRPAALGQGVPSSYSSGPVAIPPSPSAIVPPRPGVRPRLDWPPPALLPVPPLSAPLPSSTLPPQVVVIAVSTGGPAALDALLPALPAGFPLPVLIVQHMPELFTRLLAERLHSRCPLHVGEAVSGEPIRPGHIYIAKGGWHMEVAQASLDRHVASSVPILRLNQDPPENHCRPAADVLFRTAVAFYGSRVLGVVLTGMGYDGLAGSRVIREHAGVVLAQDQPTSAVWGMPGAVAQVGLANRILPLNAIAPEILRLAGRGQYEAVALQESAV